MEDIVNRNIDLFISVSYDDEDNLVISTLISENNHINNIGNFTKDTKTNLERFLNLYSNLSNPFIVAYDLQDTISLLFKESRKHKLINNKLFNDFYHKKDFFIDASDNIFLSKENSSDFDNSLRTELQLVSLFLDYIYFYYNIKINSSEIDQFASQDRTEGDYLNPEYIKKIDYLKHKTIADFKDKPYYEELFQLIEDYNGEL